MQRSLKFITRHIISFCNKTLSSKVLNQEIERRINKEEKKKKAEQ